MKYLFFFSFLAVFFAVAVPGPSSVTADKPGNITIEAQMPGNFDFDEDTLSTSSSTDQVIFDLGYVYAPTGYAMQLNADSLSGATGATCVLEVALDMGTSDFATFETLTINGVSTRLYDTGSLIRGHWRCRCDAPSSTQLTVVRLDVATFGTELKSTF